MDEGLTSKDYFSGFLSLANTALPLFVDSPGKSGTTAQTAAQVAPAPVGAVTGAAGGPGGFFEQNKMLVLGGGVVAVIALYLLIRK